MPDVARYYEILGLGPEATPEQVKQAFRELARQWHPDTAAQDPSSFAMAQEKMRELNAAYEFLKSQRPSPVPAISPPPAAHHTPGDGRRHAGGTTDVSSQAREEAAALDLRIRRIERLYLETMEQQRRLNNGLCRECGRPLSKLDRLLGNKTHGRCVPQDP